MLSDLLLALVSGVDDWVWLAIGAGLFLLILLAVILALRARRTRTPDDGTAFAWDDPAAAPLPEPAIAPDEGGETAAFSEPVLEPAPVPTDAEGGVHYCRCPACQTQFTVTGAKPIVTNCPGCGKKGYLR